MSTFTNKELELMFEGVANEVKAVSKQIDENHASNAVVHEAILAQVMSTNGRVRVLEQWRWGLAGGLSVLTALVLPILMRIVDTWIIK